jgi:hypothetical protein
MLDVTTFEVFQHSMKTNKELSIFEDFVVILQKITQKEGVMVK